MVGSLLMGHRCSNAELEIWQSKQLMTPCVKDGLEIPLDLPIPTYGNTVDAKLRLLNKNALTNIKLFPFLFDSL